MKFYKLLFFVEIKFQSCEATGEPFQVAYDENCTRACFQMCGETPGEGKLIKLIIASLRGLSTNGVFDLQANAHGFDSYRIRLSKSHFITLRDLQVTGLK